MKHIRIAICVLAVNLLASCEDKPVLTSDVVTISLPKNALSADGTSTLKVTGFLPINAVPDKRSITFKASNGSFQNGTGNSVTLKAETTAQDGKWPVFATYIASLDSGSAKIYAVVEGFTDSVTVSLLPVQAEKIKLTADAFAVKVAFQGELNLLCQLFSAGGGSVSKGRKVKFLDTTLGGAPVGGSFRSVVSSSNDKSTVSSIYSPGLASPGSYIYLKAIVIDPSAKQNVRDSIKIYLTP